MTMTLKQWIEAEKLTQSKAAKRLGVDAPTLSRWLSGRFSPNLVRAYKVEKATKGVVPMWTWVSRKPPFVSAPKNTVISQAEPTTEKLTPASDS